MARKIEVVSDKKNPIPDGIKSITIDYPEIVTGEMWVAWFDVYDQHLGKGEFDRNKRSPGKQLEAKYLASLPFLEAVKYVDKDNQIHDAKQEGLKAPLCVCQHVASTVDFELYQSLNIPKA